MNPVEVLEVLEKRGAVLRGHFRLSSGRHSDVFVQKFRVFEDPRLTQRFGASIAGLFDEPFDLVVSPAIGALVLGFATALEADTQFIFAERVDERLALRRGFSIAPRARALVVEDVVTTGGSAREVVELVRAAGGEAVGVGALLDRSDPSKRPDLVAPLRALARLDAASWSPDECPLCRDVVPIDDPGSRRL